MKTPHENFLRMPLESYMHILKELEVVHDAVIVIEPKDIYAVANFRLKRLRK